MQMQPLFFQYMLFPDAVVLYEEIIKIDKIGKSWLLWNHLGNQNYSFFIMKTWTFHSANTASPTLWKFAYHSRSKWMSSQIPCYHNSVATFCIIISGDAEVNPGPPKNNQNATKTAPRCVECDKPVATNHRRCVCCTCFDSPMLNAPKYLMRDLVRLQLQTIGSAIVVP